MTNNAEDPLHEQLDALRTDLTDVHMPGPHAARRRGARRTRNQVTGAVLAGVAAIAIGVIGTTQDGIFAAPEPVGPTQSPTPAPTDIPTVVPSPMPDEQQETGAELSEALMTADDISGDELTWTVSEEPNPAVECGPPINEAAVLDEAGIDFTADDGNGMMQHLIRTESETVAEELLDDIQDEMESCLPESPVEGEPWRYNVGGLENVGEEGWITSYSTDPADQDAPAPTVTLVRYADVVSVMVRTEPTRSNDGSLDLETPAQATARMCEVLFETTCVGQPEFDDGLGGDASTDDGDTGDGG
ncbi:hypothetical protein [Phytoactinopolyspora halotolerans]|uniref:Uncharacterized protein n=1 Tax=Phytoactinopolyspora halotolerans TaxID=1981512 RepID=A0A6L9S2U9_9ACTN|nr:hypothetical protein [Phytoactinopolyspora halotolerans]NED99525.1 hypothetical protein [Phytoactinopolyspora halotolerans]